MQSAGDGCGRVKKPASRVNDSGNMGLWPVSPSGFVNPLPSGGRQQTKMMNSRWGEKEDWKVYSPLLRIAHASRVLAITSSRS